jgi:hypothetical protein
MMEHPHSLIREAEARLSDYFAGGSGLAQNAPALDDLARRIRAAGSRAPVFALLADRLDALWNSGSPEDLADAALLADSVSTALLPTDDGSETREPDYPACPFEPKPLTYLETRERVSALSGSHGFRGVKETLETLVAEDSCGDPAYFGAYRLLFSQCHNDAER